MSPSLQHKVDRAIKLLRAIPTTDGPIEIAYSGGKDSDIILHLAQMAGIPYEAIYKNTTIDPPGTLKHCRDVGATIIQPKNSFAQLIAQKGFPSRWCRFCCAELKEYKIRDRAVHGIRREESTKRAQRYKEPEICRLYPGKQKARIYLPILDWTLDDVSDFISCQHIPLAPLYYDPDGSLHPERRLGCLCCPLMTQKNRVREFQQYPNMAKLYLNNAQLFFNNKNSKLKQRFHEDVYEYLFLNLFPDSQLDSPLFPEYRIDPKAELESLLHTDLTLRTPIL